MLVTTIEVQALKSINDRIYNLSRAVDALLSAGEGERAAEILNLISEVAASPAKAKQ